MNNEKWKKLWEGYDSPQVFWSTYIIYITLMIAFVYLTWVLHSEAFFIILVMMIATGSLFPIMYLYKRRKKA